MINLLINIRQPLKNLLLAVGRYTIYLPFQMLFSYVVGPILAVILMVGGIAVLMLILGYEDGIKVFRHEWRQSGALI